MQCEVWLLPKHTSDKIVAPALAVIFSCTIYVVLRDKAFKRRAIKALVYAVIKRLVERFARYVDS